MGESSQPSSLPVLSEEEKRNVDFDIRVIDGSVGVIARWARGKRSEMEAALFGDSTSLEHPYLGLVKSIGNGAALVSSRLSDLGVVLLEVDLQPQDEDGVTAPLDSMSNSRLAMLRCLVMWGWGTGAESEELAKALLERPIGPISSKEPRLAATLEESGWAVADAWLLTSVSPITDRDQTPWCVRGARILYSDQGLLVAWHALFTAQDWYRTPDKSLITPLPERLRRRGQLFGIEGNSGVDYAGRLIQDILQHHEWTVWQLTQRVEEWERDFFGAAREGAFFDGFDLQNLGVRLDEIHKLVVQLRQVGRDLDRRADLAWLPAPTMADPAPSMNALNHEVHQRVKQMQERIESLNGSLREGWTLLASAAAGAQVEFQRSTQELQQRFQNAAAFVAALVLVPGLVISLYSANVKGLPGLGYQAGLRNIGIYALLGAAITGGSLNALANGRRILAYSILYVGVVGLLLTTLILL